MKSFLLCGIAIASVLLIQPVPASAQHVRVAGYSHIGHGHAGHWHGGYARGYGPGYGIGAGAAAVATGALIGGAIAAQNQGYYYYPDQTYSGYSDPGYVYSDAASAGYNNGGAVAISANGPIEAGGPGVTINGTSCYFTDRLVNPVTQSWVRERVCTTVAP